MHAYSDDPFCLGMCEWTDCASMAKLRPSAEPLPSTSSCSFSVKEPLPPVCTNEPLPCQRFTFASEEQLADLAKGIVPFNTPPNQLSGLLKYLKIGSKSEMNDSRVIQFLKTFYCLPIQHSSIPISLNLLLKLEK